MCHFKLSVFLSATFYILHNMAEERWVNWISYILIILNNRMMLAVFYPQYNYKHNHFAQVISSYLSVPVTWPNELNNLNQSKWRNKTA